MGNIVVQANSWQKKIGVLKIIKLGNMFVLNPRISPAGSVLENLERGNMSVLNNRIPLPPPADLE